MLCSSFQYGGTDRLVLSVEGETYHRDYHHSSEFETTVPHFSHFESPQLKVFNVALIFYIFLFKFPFSRSNVLKKEKVAIKQVSVLSFVRVT
jgi:hypothetical protein